MMTIYTDGQAFMDICKDALLIHGMKRDSYALRFSKEEKTLWIIAPVNGIWNIKGDTELLEAALDSIWYMNLKIGGITADADTAEKLSCLFCDRYKGVSRILMREGERMTCLFEEGSRKRALFAGGCFWCISMPFYGTQGVLSVKSGYAGGEELNPTYLEVKHQETHHKECILVEYDSSLVDYERILEVFFENIDPFDTEGQYIDRGDSYAPAVFTSDKEERACVIEYKYQLSDECERLCTLPLLENAPFFLAEEEHQDFAIRHPKEMEEELIASGRKKI